MKLKCPHCHHQVIHLALNWFVCKGRQCGQLWQEFEIIASLPEIMSVRKQE